MSSRPGDQFGLYTEPQYTEPLYCTVKPLYCTVKPLYCTVKPLYTHRVTPAFSRHGRNDTGCIPVLAPPPCATNIPGESNSPEVAGLIKSVTSAWSPEYVPPRSRGCPSCMVAPGAAPSRRVGSTPPYSAPPADWLSPSAPAGRWAQTGSAASEAGST
eukprot:955445-Prorocentrum_minimum.AAC.1